jgi:hypothetical protein
MRGDVEVPTTYRSYYMEVAQLARAHRLGRWGRRFESCLPYHVGKRQRWRVVPDCKSGVVWLSVFDSHLSHHLLYIPEDP